MLNICKCHEIAQWVTVTLTDNSVKLNLGTLSNEVTSPETVLNGNSVTTMLYKTLPPYFIALARSMKTEEVKDIEIFTEFGSELQIDRQQGVIQKMLKKLYIPQITLILMLTFSFF